MRSLMKAWPVLLMTGRPPAACTISMVFQVSRGSWMMAAPGMPGQQRLGHEAHQIVALDKASLFIKEEAAVKVAVPGQAHVGAVVAHRLGRGVPILRQQGVGDAVGKSRVRLMVHLDEPEGQMLLQASSTGPAQPLPALTTTLRGFRAAKVDIAQQVGDIGLEGVGGHPPAPGLGLGRELPGRGQQPQCPGGRCRR